MINFEYTLTTYKQSKKLLELGIPKESADFWYDMCEDAPRKPHYNNYNLHDFDNLDREYPCWSVGRLIEIFEKCTGTVWHNEIIEGYTKIEMLIEDFDGRCVSIDFKKLNK